MAVSRELCKRIRSQALHTRTCREPVGKTARAPSALTLLRRTIFLICLLVASKFYDDCSIINCDFQETCESFLSLEVRFSADRCFVIAGVESTPATHFLTLLAHLITQRINDVEMALLAGLQYECIVSRAEYAANYFTCRALLARYRQESSVKGQGAMRDREK